MYYEDMRNIFIGVVLTLIIAALHSPIHAFSPPTTFKGTFILANGKPWNRGLIRIDCFNLVQNGNYVDFNVTGNKDVLTDVQGSFFVNFNSETECPIGSNYMISYEFWPGCYGRTGCIVGRGHVPALTGKVSDYEGVFPRLITYDFNLGTINLDGDPNNIFDEIPIVPEFNSTSMLFAGIASLGSFLLFRKRITPFHS